MRNFFFAFPFLLLFFTANAQIDIASFIIDTTIASYYRPGSYPLNWQFNSTEIINIPASSFSIDIYDTSHSLLKHNSISLSSCSILPGNITVENLHFMCSNYLEIDETLANEEVYLKLIFSSNDINVISSNFYVYPSLTITFISPPPSGSNKLSVLTLTNLPVTFKYTKSVYYEPVDFSFELDLVIKNGPTVSQRLIDADSCTNQSLVLFECRVFAYQIPIQCENKDVYFRVVIPNEDAYAFSTEIHANSTFSIIDCDVTKDCNSQGWCSLLGECVCFPGYLGADCGTENTLSSQKLGEGAVAAIVLTWILGLPLILFLLYWCYKQGYCRSILP